MSLSTRYSIQWPESVNNEEQELTSTLVLTSPKGLFVDVRILKDTDTTDEVAFDWYFAGIEIEIPSKQNLMIEFDHKFLDSQYIDHHYAHNFTHDGFKMGSDVGTFFDAPDKTESAMGIRYETGEMCNPESGNVEPYIEKWISCNPNKSTLEYIGKSDDNSNGLKCIVLDTVDGGIDNNYHIKNVSIGRLIILGGWIQGIFWEKGVSDKIESLGIVRRFGEHKPLISYGGQVNKFPESKQLTGLKVDDIVVVDTTKWVVKETSNW